MGLNDQSTAINAHALLTSSIDSMNGESTAVIVRELKLPTTGASKDFLSPTLKHLIPAERKAGAAASSQDSLLSRQANFALPLAFILYIIIEVALGSQNQICTIRENPLSSWTYQYNAAIAACFILSAVHHAGVGWLLGKTSNSIIGGLGHPQSVYFAAATLSLIAGISSFISPLCIDALGIETYRNQWPEWLIAAPLLGYVTIAIEDKPALTRTDLTVIFLMFLTIFFGFVMNFYTEPNSTMGWLFFTLSSLCVGGNIMMAIWSDRKLSSLLKSESPKLNSEWQADRLHRKSRLAWLLVISLPTFAIIYILKYLNAIDRDVLVVGNMILGLMTKLVFVAMLSFEALSVQISQEQSANDSRRRFLRYVFHEVRVPLNTLTMGLSVLEHDYLPKLQQCDPVGSEVSNEALMMMTGAAGFMNDTLNDVLSMSKIEDGSMTLTMQSFKLESLVSGAMVVIKGQARAKEINLAVEKEYVNWDPSCGDISFSGDRFRLEHVLVNFLSNAIKFSPEGSTVTVKVFVECPPPPAQSLSAAAAAAAAAGRRNTFFAPTSPAPSVPVPPPSIVVGSSVSAQSAPGPPFVAEHHKKNKEEVGILGAALSFLTASVGAVCRVLFRGITRIDSHGLLPVADPDYRPRSGGSSANGDAGLIPQAGRAIPHAKLSIVIVDQGVGISPENQRKLFIPFSQIRSHELQQGRGTGLGLVLAKEIVELHGGHVVIESAEGKGSTFGIVLDLPLLLEESQLNPVSSAAILSRSTSMGSATGTAAAAPAAVAAAPLPLPRSNRTSPRNSNSTVQDIVDARIAAQLQQATVIAPAALSRETSRGSVVNVHTIGYLSRATSSSRRVIPGGDDDKEHSTTTPPGRLKSPRKPPGAAAGGGSRSGSRSGSPSPSTTDGGNVDTCTDGGGGGSGNGGSGNGGGDNFVTQISRGLSRGGSVISSHNGSHEDISAAAAGGDNLPRPHHTTRRNSVPYESSGGAAPVASSSSSSSTAMIHRRTSFVHKVVTYRIDETEYEDDSYSNSSRFNKNGGGETGDSNSSSAAAGGNANRPLFDKRTDGGGTIPLSAKTGDAASELDRVPSDEGEFVRQKPRAHVAVNSSTASGAGSGPGSGSESRPGSGPGSGLAAGTERVGDTGSQPSLRSNLSPRPYSTSQLSAAQQQGHGGAASSSSLSSSSFSSSHQSKSISSQLQPQLQQLSGGTPMMGSAAYGASRAASEYVGQRSLLWKDGHRPHYLLVDDTVSNCKMLRMLLSRYEVDSELAYNGQEAIDTIRDHGDRFAVIFMDHTMPVKNGLEATSEIRALGFPGLIIGLTGNALDDDVERFLQAGADAVYAKPFTDSQLASIVQIVKAHGSLSSPEVRQAMQIATGRSRVTSVAKSQSPAW